MKAWRTPILDMKDPVPSFGPCKTTVFFLIPPIPTFRHMIWTSSSSFSTFFSALRTWKLVSIRTFSYETSTPSSMSIQTITLTLVFIRINKVTNIMLSCKIESSSLPCSGIPWRRTSETWVFATLSEIISFVRISSYVGIRTKFRT